MHEVCLQERISLDPRVESVMRIHVSSTVDGVSPLSIIRPAGVILTYNISGDTRVGPPARRLKTPRPQTGHISSKRLSFVFNASHYKTALPFVSEFSILPQKH